MRIHLAWLRVPAAAAATALLGVAVQPAAAQYVPYQPNAQQSTTPAAAAAQPGQSASATTPYTPNMAYRPQTQASVTPYPTTTYPAYRYVAEKQPVEAMPAPNRPSTSAARPSTSAAMGGPTAMGSTPAAEAMNAAQPCGCNGMTAYGTGDNYSSAGCGYPDCNGISQYFGNECCSENQWFGGVYFLEMGRTNETPIKLTTEIPTGATYPYYPPSTTTILDSRDVNFDFREGVEVRIGSTFTLGGPRDECQADCGGYGYGYPGCNTCNACSCAPPTTYGWEVAWWGLNDSPSTETAVYNGTNRIVGMKNFVGAQYDFSGGGFNPVNGYYGYGLPVQALTGTENQILAQRVRADFKAQNLELNIIRFPMTCGSCGTGCYGGCGGYETCGCNTNNTGCNSCGCTDNCGLGFSMYGSCGVRYFHIDDDFMYADEFNPAGGTHTFDGFTYDNIYELQYDVRVKNDLVGPQVGWTTDYCWGRWNLFCNSTFGIFDNHMRAVQRLWSGGGDEVILGDGSTFNVHSNKDAVAFLGELRVGTAYDFTCHWRGVIAYRAVAITGVATASTQLDSDYMDRATVAIIDSDNAMIIHGAQVGAECRY
ncbi:MAG TPA: BBP7 family outer membrane beta-barrel protein [Lacipirellulaceae bacterium]|nr:BBP7 family outer membrane beta-barrel protein [Lacipirellulaceae bacterium]